MFGVKYKGLLIRGETSHLGGIPDLSDMLFTPGLYEKSCPLESDIFHLSKPCDVLRV